MAPVTGLFKMWLSLVLKSETPLQQRTQLPNLAYGFRTDLIKPAGCLSVPLLNNPHNGTPTHNASSGTCTGSIRFTPGHMIRAGLQGLQLAYGAQVRPIQIHVCHKGRASWCFSSSLCVAGSKLKACSKGGFTKKHDSVWTDAKV